jgi:hypothetical protein
MKLGIEVPIPAGELRLSSRLVAGIVEAAFNDTNGGCKHWLAGPVTGGHTASPAEDRRRHRLAADLSIPPCWLLLTLKGAYHAIPYRARNVNCSARLTASTIATGVAQLLQTSHDLTIGGLATLATPEIADWVVQLGLFGGVIFTSRRTRVA